MNEAQRRDNDGRVRSNETPHGIDGGGVPLTSEGVTRPRIVAARRPPRSVYSSGFRKRMASPRHDRSSVTKPSRASSYSKSDDCAPSRAWSRPPRAVMHQRRTEVVEFAAGVRRGPPRVTSIREDALRRPRRPQNDRTLWWHALCDAAEHKNATRPERACGGTIFQRASYLGLLVPFAA